MALIGAASAVAMLVERQTTNHAGRGRHGSGVLHRHRCDLGRRQQVPFEQAACAIRVPFPGVFAPEQGMPRKKTPNSPCKGAFSSGSTFANRLACIGSNVAIRLEVRNDGRSSG
jgi:hypothetical protein